MREVVREVVVVVILLVVSRSDREDGCGSDCVEIPDCRPAAA